MPHQCTNCGRAFDDGSKEMLGGCPDCGGNKFQFLPPGTATAPAGAGGDGQPDEPATPGDPEPAGDGDIIEAPVEPVDEPTGGLEDSAQAAARRSVVAEDELPRVEAQPTVDEQADEAEAPGLADLRRELNEQFESIKILRPGEYELNLMELYDREEYIIALEEDGRYVIDVPDTWRESE